MDTALWLRDITLRASRSARIARHSARNAAKFPHFQPQCSCIAPGTSWSQQSAQHDVDVQSNVQTLGSKTEEEHDDKEQLRRRKISEANKGNVPWNKGRKHSPETIAKIKARTAEAMQRPEVVAKLQASAASNVGKTHSEETKAKIGAASRSRHVKAKEQVKDLSRDELEALKLKRCSTAKAMWDDPDYREKTLAGIRKAAEERKAKRLAEQQAAGVEPPRKLTPEERREKLREAGRKAWQNPEFRERMRTQVVHLLQKRHQEMTEEEKTAWREKQREKARELWNNPEYRAKTLAAIQARHERMRENGEKPAPRKRTPRSPSSSKPRISVKKEQAASVDRLRSMWQMRLALLAKTIRTIHVLEQRLMDLSKLERALVNDPQRHAEAVNGINQATQCLELASQKVKELSSAVPSFVKYDKLGNMVSFDGEAALKHHTGAQTAPAQRENTDARPVSSPPSPLASVLPTSPTPQPHPPATSPHPEAPTPKPGSDSSRPSTSSLPRSASLPWNSRPARPLSNGTQNGAVQNGLNHQMGYPGVNGVHPNGHNLKNGVGHPTNNNGVSGNLLNGVRNGTHNGALPDGMGSGSLSNGLSSGTSNGHKPGSFLNGTHSDTTGHTLRDSPEAEDQPDGLL